MTAIGFLLIAFGAFFVYVFEAARLKTAENAALTVFGCGVILLLAGIASWLWRVMP